jgi:hypothetical protein
LVVHATEVLSGAPTEGGSWTFQVEPENAATATIGPSTEITVATEQSQNITFTSSPPSGPVVGGSYKTAATASSGLPVTITLDASSSGCTLSGSDVSLAATGTCIVDADQSGDSTYLPAQAQQESVITEYGLDVPDAVSSDGTHVWVLNAVGASVTGLKAASGSRVAVIQGAADHFVDPAAVSSDGTHVWVTSPGRYTVTELAASTGTLVRVISASTFHFDDPMAVASDGTHVWVANAGGHSVTELDASSGVLTKVISAAKFGIDEPISIAADGTHVRVADYGTTPSPN